MKNSLLLLLIICNLNVFSQSDSTSKNPWKHNFQTGINLNQATFSDNWKGGGVNSYAAGWFLNHSGTHETPKWSFRSDLQLALGFFENQGEKARKNADRIFYDFKLGYRIGSKWNAFGSVNFLTQFLEGYDAKLKTVSDPTVDSLVSNLFAPAYLTSSFGMEYKPVSYLQMRFGVGTLRQTFVLDENISNAQLYGLEKPGDKLRNQAVLQYIINFDKELVKNVDLKWRYMVNFDYMNASKPNAFVHIFNANLTLKTTRYISTNFSLNLIKDYDQDKNIQFSQVLALGILYQYNK
jgi:hypothetical protein